MGVRTRSATAVAAVITALVIVIGLGAGPAVALPSASRVAVADAVARILADTNALRAAGGLAPLVSNPSLQSVAQNWTGQQAGSGVMSHNPSYGSQIPGGWTNAAENVAKDYTYATVTEGWHQSPGHYANIMGPYTDIGIGYVEANGHRYFTQVFARYPGPSPTDRAFVLSAYADVLGRAASDAEVYGWTSLLARGTPRTAIASGFNNSDEYRLHMIDTAYQTVLGRDAESSGRQSWLSGMRRGTLQPDDTHRIFLSTEEFYLGAGGGTDAGYIEALYLDVVGRPAEASGIDYWTTRLRQVGRDSVVNGFWFAPETLNRQASTMFVHFLGRDASSSDVADWAGIIRSSGPTRARDLLMSSAEYGARALTRYP